MGEQKRSDPHLQIKYYILTCILLVKSHQVLPLYRVIFFLKFGLIFFSDLESFLISDGTLKRIRKKSDVLLAITSLSKVFTKFCFRFRSVMTGKWR